MRVNGGAYRCTAASGGLWLCASRKSQFMRIKSVLFSILGSLAAFAVSTEAFAAASGEFCGGIANVQCNADLHCVLDGSFPDAGGVCVPDYCGVWTGNVCPDGFSCDLFYPDFPDSNGVCVADAPSPHLLQPIIH